MSKSEGEGNIGRECKWSFCNLFKWEEKLCQTPLKYKYTGKYVEIKGGIEIYIVLADYSPAKTMLLQATLSLIHNPDQFLFPLLEHLYPSILVLVHPSNNNRNIVAFEY